MILSIIALALSFRGALWVADSILDGLREYRWYEYQVQRVGR